MPKKAVAPKEPAHKPVAMFAAWKDKWGRVGFTVKGLRGENRETLLAATEAYVAHCRAADKVADFPVHVLREDRAPRG